MLYNKDDIKKKHFFLNIYLTNFFQGIYKFLKLRS